MHETLRRICELQPHYSADNTPEMQERGQLVRRDLVNELLQRKFELSSLLGDFGNDFLVEASDGIGRKTELPWARFCSRRMSPTPRDGYYAVIHFSTDGSAVHFTLGCSSSQFRNGSFVTLDDAQLDRRTAWARSVILEALGSTEPFTDDAQFGASRPLPKSFERATALSKRVSIDELGQTDIDELLQTSARFLQLVYSAEVVGRDLSPADQFEAELTRLSHPQRRTGGQGFGLSAEDKRRVELRAMEVAEEWLKRQGFEVQDTSATNPFDFAASRNGEIIKVEVKGTTSDIVDAICLTRNEVNLHRKEKGDTALIIVSKIRLARSGTERQASGGELEALLAWDIDDWELEPTAYRAVRLSDNLS